MGQIALDFKPTVPVFDANVALGRRHDRRVREATVEGTLKAMERAGVDRALAYSPHAATFDSREGNDILLDMVQGQPSLVPQYVCNPSFDDLSSFAAEVNKRGVRSVRMFPMLHQYPFREWVVNPWLDLLSAEQVPLWMPAEQFDPSALHDVLKDRPNISVVLSEVHYRQAAWALPLLRSLPNLFIEISRFLIADVIARLIDAVGDQRILYGSRFPDSPMASHLYVLHRSGLSEASLRSICSGNLERLLGVE